MLLAGGLTFDRWVAATDLPPLKLATSDTVLDRQDRLLRAYTVADGRWRLPVTPDAVDDRFVEILLAFEDRRFRRHAGVDLRAMARAGWQALRQGRMVSGASTLTMQVARLLEDSGTGRLSGKLRQIRVALALERQLDKDQILTLYLHLAPYGGNIEGVRAASLSWFGKEPARLTPAQAALLVALPQSPRARRPDRHPDAARDARGRVLDRAVAAGVISSEAAQAAKREALPTARRAFPALAPHLADRLRQPGTAVRTTLDAPLQATLERLVAAQARALGPRVSGALVVAEHGSGEILASVGSAGWQQARAGWIDMTRAVRSPGSTLKPLIYGLAFDLGLAHPETLVEDRPTSFGGYTPQNFDRTWRGTITLRRALQTSANIPAVTVLEAAGPATLLAALDRAGVTPRLPPGDRPGLALALGGLGVTLEEMTGLYAGLARGGRAVALSPLKDQARSGGGRILGPGAAWQVGSVLAGLAPPGGGAPGAVAYKTGTSYGYRDAWALGFDGRHAVGVWFGRPDGGTLPGTLGAQAAAPVLFDALARVAPLRRPLPPPPPQVLTVTTAELPPPLRHIGRGADGVAGQGPRIAFPPDGARLTPRGGQLSVRLQRGAPPFRWLLDGRPLDTDPWEREVSLPLAGQGFATVSVIDASGSADRVQVFVLP